MKGYTAYVLDASSKAKLLKKFPPKFIKIIAHHITDRFGVDESDVPWIAGFYNNSDIKVIGYIDDLFLEALIVSIDGKTERPDGGTFHITLSLDPTQRSPKDSNLITNRWMQITPITIEAKPTFIPFTKRKYLYCDRCGIETYIDSKYCDDCIEDVK